MTLEQGVMIVQVVGLPLIGWLVYELRSLRREVGAQIGEIREKQNGQGERIARLEAVAEAA
jgi:hypothetical protein